MRQMDYRDIRPREIPASFATSDFVRDAGWLVKRAVRWVSPAVPGLPYARHMLGPL
ncbi:hypothetical protein PENCOP_c001G00533 [Penicillium coprophilum]|uniref:Uncharacterized protein n=1 Tax=Penicillium coprophilum TaxID=36646 RepID=A0A1V6VA18_9EURO|nr:hypothetical protein PENCOP_c001G00533 [Penicillium coprophilum]